MAWFQTGDKHYLNQWRLTSVMPYGVTRPQWVNLFFFFWIWICQQFIKRDIGLYHFPNFCEILLPYIISDVVLYLRCSFFFVFRTCNFLSVSLSTIAQCNVSIVTKVKAIPAGHRCSIFIVQGFYCGGTTCNITIYLLFGFYSTHGWDLVSYWFWMCFSTFQELCTLFKGWLVLGESQGP